MATTEQIKSLRETTGVSMTLCKKALDESNGDMDGALEFLRKAGADVADKKAGRALKAGIIDAYVHSTRQNGVLLEMRSESDFVAKNEEFKNFAHDIAMHIAACAPADIAELLKQPYIKNPAITIENYIKEKIQKFGENIEVGQFTRYNV